MINKCTYLQLGCIKQTRDTSSWFQKTKNSVSMVQLNRTTNKKASEQVRQTPTKKGRIKQRGGGLDIIQQNVFI